MPIKTDFITKMLDPKTGVNYNLEASRGNLFLVPRPGNSSPPRPNADRDQNMVNAAKKLEALIATDIFKELSETELNQIGANLSLMALRMHRHASDTAKPEIERHMSSVIAKTIKVEAPKPNNGSSYAKWFARALTVSAVVALYLYA